MTKVTTEMVKKLRDATGAGVLDAKKALEAADGNFEEAVDALRAKGAKLAAKRAGREASEGVIETYTHLASRIGVMLELNCETDFVARNEQFRELAHDLALHIAAMNPQYLTREEVPQEDLEREMEVLKEQAAAEGKPEHIVDKIVEGRLSKFYGEKCLMEQPFVKNEEVTVQELITETIGTIGENIVLRRFVRYERGETVE
jgi:elongation factor Ts